MAESRRTERLGAQGETFAEALEHLLDSLTWLAFEVDREAATRSTRFQSEAATLPELVRDAIDDVTSLANELELAIADVAVDGHRPIDGGHRCWGTVQLAPPAIGYSVSILDGPQVARDPDGSWRIEVTLATD